MAVGDVVITGEQLRAMRCAVGLSQKELSRRLSYSSPVVGCWERGIWCIPPAVYPRLMRLLRDELVCQVEGRNHIRRLAAVCCGSVTF